MKPSLQLRISQSLTMTPQLQQAIKLLQLSSLELQTEIQQALDSNPMLEMADEHDDGLERLDAGDAERASNEQEQERVDALQEQVDFDRYEQAAERADRDYDSSSADQPVADSYDNDSSAVAEAESFGDEAIGDTADALASESIRDELPVDAQWEDWDFTPPSGGGAGSEDDDYEYQGKTSESLQDHLLWQLNLTPFSDLDRAIAQAIIDAIDDNGYLRAGIDEILECMGEDSGVEADEVEAVLRRIQHFDPPGVAARDLAECLLIQLRLRGGKDSASLHAIQIVRDHLALLGARDFRTLMRKMRIGEDQLRAAVSLIQSLNPRPGSAMARDESSYVTPDILVSKKRGRWTVELNSDVSPRLRINTSYASLIQRARNSSDNTFLRNHLQEAKWFIKSLQSRNETLLRVATAIVEQQIGFFEHGEEAMKPMVLADIAELLGLHESTISRVTTNKYMHTPRGIFELKYFFSSHLGTAGGGEASSTAIRALIKKLVAQEETSKPLSDSQIAQILGEQGINVARRTVAKYREAMSIPPSSERKSLV